MAELERIARILDDFGDVLTGRVSSPEPPAWATKRHWDAYLLGLRDDDVLLAEERGLWALDASNSSASLRALCDEARALCEPFQRGPHPESSFEEQHVPLRKRAQVAALVRALRGELDAVDRIVDIGAGHGHFARAAHAELETPVVGVDRDDDRVQVARDLAGVEIAFAQGTPESVDLRARDLVVGLHACGALGDALLRRAATMGSSVLLVSCCAQKIDTDERAPLSSGGLAFPRPLLGLSNLSWGPAAARGMRGREVRHALRLLLSTRGIEETAGSVAHGIHKKRFRKGLGAVAEDAFRQRGLASPTAGEIRAHETRGAAEFGRIRRLSLPRNMLGRLMELCIVFDRARFLEERDYAVDVVPAFSTEVSPRNLCVLAKHSRTT